MRLGTIRMAALIPAALSGASAGAQSPTKPNVVIFLVDDMGPMDTSVPFMTDKNGSPQRYPLNEWYHTPNMERLAETGIRFSNFYAQSVSSADKGGVRIID